MSPSRRIAHVLNKKHARGHESGVVLFCRSNYSILPQNIMYNQQSIGSNFTECDSARDSNLLDWNGQGHHNTRVKPISIKALDEHSQRSENSRGTPINNQIGTSHVAAEATCQEPSNAGNLCRRSCSFKADVLLLRLSSIFSPMILTDKDELHVPRLTASLREATVTSYPSYRTLSDQYPHRSVRARYS